MERKRFKASLKKILWLLDVRKQNVWIYHLCEAYNENGKWWKEYLAPVNQCKQIIIINWSINWTILRLEKQIENWEVFFCK